MWQKIKCWLGLELNTYLISYNFSTKQGNGFGRVLFKAKKSNRKAMEQWEHQININLGGEANIVILNIVRLDDD